MVEYMQMNIEVLLIVIRNGVLGLGFVSLLGIGVVWFKAARKDR